MLVAGRRVHDGIARLPVFARGDEAHVAHAGSPERRPSTQLARGAADEQVDRRAVVPAVRVPTRVLEADGVEARPDVPLDVGVEAGVREPDHPFGVSGGVVSQHQRHVRLDGGSVRPDRADTVRTVDCVRVVRVRGVRRVQFGDFVDDRTFGVARVALLPRRPQRALRQSRDVVGEQAGVVPVARVHRPTQVEDVLRRDLVHVETVRAGIPLADQGARVVTHSRRTPATATTCRDGDGTGAQVDRRDADDLVFDLEVDARQDERRVLQPAAVQIRDEDVVGRQLAVIRSQQCPERRLEQHDIPCQRVSQQRDARGAEGGAVLVRVARPYQRRRQVNLTVAAEDRCDRDGIGVPVDGSEPVVRVAVTGTPQRRVAERLAHVRPHHRRDRTCRGSALPEDVGVFETVRVNRQVHAGATAAARPVDPEPVLDLDSLARLEAHGGVFEIVRDVRAAVHDVAELPHGAGSRLVQRGRVGLHERRPCLQEHEVDAVVGTRSGVEVDDVVDVSDTRDVRPRDGDDPAVDVRPQHRLRLVAVERVHGGPRDAELEVVDPQRAELEVVFRPRRVHQEPGWHDASDVLPLPLQLHRGHQVQFGVQRGLARLPDDRSPRPVGGAEGPGHASSIIKRHNVPPTSHPAG